MHLTSWDTVAVGVLGAEPGRAQQWLRPRRCWAEASLERAGPAWPWACRTQWVLGGWAEGLGCGLLRGAPAQLPPRPLRRGRDTVGVAGRKGTQLGQARAWRGGGPSGGASPPPPPSLPRGAGRGAAGHTHVSLAPAAVTSAKTWLLFLPFAAVKTKAWVVLSIGVFMALLTVSGLVILGHLFVFHLYLSMCPRRPVRPARLRPHVCVLGPPPASAR